VISGFLGYNFQLFGADLPLRARQAMAKHRKAAKTKVVARKKAGRQEENRGESPGIRPRANRFALKSRNNPRNSRQAVCGQAQGDKKEAKRAEKAALTAGKQDKRLAPAVAELKPKNPPAPDREGKALVREFERKELSPLEAEARRVRLKNLIVLGKEPQLPDLCRGQRSPARRHARCRTDREHHQHD